jgi:lipase chaperone LimK
MVVRKPLDLPSAVARAFVADMKAFFAEENRYRQDEIASRRLHALKEHQRPRERPLRLSDVKQMFLEMKGIVG